MADACKWKMGLTRAHHYILVEAIEAISMKFLHSAQTINLGMNLKKFRSSI